MLTAAMLRLGEGYCALVTPLDEVGGSRRIVAWGRSGYGLCKTARLHAVLGALASSFRVWRGGSRESRRRLRGGGRGRKRPLADKDSSRRLRGDTAQDQNKRWLSHCASYPGVEVQGQSCQ